MGKVVYGLCPPLSLGAAEPHQMTLKLLKLAWEVGVFRSTFLFHLNRSEIVLFV